MTKDDIARMYPYLSDAEAAKVLALHEAGSAFRDELVKVAADRADVKRMLLQNYSSVLHAAVQMAITQ